MIYVFFRKCLETSGGNGSKKNQEAQGSAAEPIVNKSEQQSTLLKRLHGALDKTPSMFTESTKNGPETVSDNADKNINLESLATKKAEVLAEIASINTEYPMAASSDLAQKFSSLEETFRTTKKQERFAKYIPDYKTGDEDRWTSEDLKVPIKRKMPDKTTAEIASEENELIGIKIAEIENNPELKNEVMTAINRSKEYNSKIKTLEDKANTYNDALRELSLAGGDSKMVPIAENLRRIHGGATERIQEGQKLQEEKITLGRVGSDPFALGKQVYEHFNKI